MYGNFDFGGLTIPLDDIPESDRAKLMITTLRHKFGNEVDAAACKVRDKAKEAAEKNGEEFDGEEVKEAAIADLRQKMLTRLLDGTLGLRVGGPRGSTIENIAWDLAYKQAQATLAPKGYWPQGTKDIKAEDATIDFDGQVMNREALTDMVYEKYKDKFTEEAKVVHQERVAKAKANKANKVPVKAKVEESIADLI